MNQPIQIALPEETIQLLDRFTNSSETPEEVIIQRSNLINEAVKDYLAQKQNEILKQQLQEGAIQRSDRDLTLAEDYFHLEEEAWQKPKKPGFYEKSLSPHQTLHRNPVSEPGF